MPVPSPSTRLISTHEELHLHLWIERLPLSPVGLCVKFQTPNHLRIRVLAQIREYLGERRACLGRPGVYAAVGGGEGCEGFGGAKGIEHCKGNGNGGCGEASGGVKDVGRYRIVRWGCC